MSEFQAFWITVVLTLLTLDTCDSHQKTHQDLQDIRNAIIRSK